MRLWQGVGLWGKIKLFFQLILGTFLDEEVSEEELERMKSQDILTSTLDELADSFPQFKAILIDERDQYLPRK
jgi:pheromone shutdown protein TraB